MSDLFTKMKLGGVHHYAGFNFELIQLNADVNTLRWYSWPDSGNRIHYKLIPSSIIRVQKHYKYKETYYSPTNKPRYFGVIFYAYKHGKMFESASIHVLVQTIVKYSEKVERLERSFTPRGK